MIIKYEKNEKGTTEINTCCCCGYTYYNYYYETQDECKNQPFFRIRDVCVFTNLLTNEFSAFLVGYACPKCGNISIGIEENIKGR